MKKSLILFVGLLSFSSVVMAARLVSKPEFEQDYIKMSARGGFCGGVTLVPKAGQQVKVIARRFYQSLYSAGVKPGEILSEWVELSPGGLRVKYDWAGPRPSYHYRIFCAAQNERGYWVPTSCEEVVELDDKQHNRACVGGLLGSGTKSYEPLNMRREKSE